MTRGIAEEMVTQHLMRDLGHSVTLVNVSTVKERRQGHPTVGLVRMKHILLTYMFAQDTGTLL